MYAIVNIKYITANCYTGIHISSIDDITDTPHGWGWGVKEKIFDDPENYEYAGFLIRFIAQLIDGLILSVILSAFSVIVIVPIMFLASASGDPGAAASQALTCMAFIVMAGMFIVMWLYYAGFESSRFMGTPGKMMFHIKVTDLNGNGISLSKATQRFILKMVLNLFFSIGYLYILISDKKQGLYDALAGTMVIRYG